MRCLEDSRLDYVHDGANQYAWNVVTNVRNETENFERVFAVHIGQYRTPYMNSAYDESGLVVVDENPPCPNEEVAADDLKAIMVDVPPPACVTSVGISAVSEKFMKELWNEIISDDPNTFDVAGRGYMVHPMWMRFGRYDQDESHVGYWGDVREMSCNFGWT